MFRAVRAFGVGIPSLDDELGHDSMERRPIVKTFLASSMKLVTWLGATSGKNFKVISPNGVWMIACCSDIFLTSSNENFLYRTSCEKDGDIIRLEKTKKYQDQPNSFHLITSLFSSDLNSSRRVGIGFAFYLCSPGERFFSPPHQKMEEEVTNASSFPPKSLIPFKDL